jgi:hypothetical protein
MWSFSLNARPFAAFVSMEDQVLVGRSEHRVAVWLRAEYISCTWYVLRIPDCVEILVKLITCKQAFRSFAVDQSWAAKTVQVRLRLRPLNLLSKCHSYSLFVIAVTTVQDNEIKYIDLLKS